MSISPDRSAVFDELRAARPEVDPHLTDPGSSRAVALRDRIVAEQPAPDATLAAIGGHGRPSGRQPPRRRRLSIVAAAALVLAVAATVAGDRFGLDRPEPAAASLDEVVAASMEATRGSGRATVAYQERRPDGADVSTTADVAFSGNDVDLVSRQESGLTDRLDGDEFHWRLVDGEFYYVRDDESGWTHDDLRRDPGAVPIELFNVDPRVWLQTLQPEADFVLVGEEELDRRHVRHFRATSPRAVSGVDLGLGEIDAGAIDEVDAWVDDEDVVYRLDLGLTRNARATQVFWVDPGAPCPPGSEPSDVDARDLSQPGTPCQATEEPLWVPGTYSVRFYDLGTPVTISAPPDAIDLSSLTGPTVP